MGSAAANVATHTMSDVGLARMVCGLLFPFGLCMALLLGAEVFNGSCLMPLAILEKRATMGGMLKNWLCVYTGNFLGALSLAVACAYSGELDYTGGLLAVYTIRVAVTKCALAFSDALVLGFLCNLLVGMAVLCSLAARDTVGKMLGAYIPIAFFVICGFENSVANMYYIPAGLFANSLPRYATLATQQGVCTEALNWTNYFLKNLLPVTLGNILGGVAIGLLMWVCHMKWAQNNVPEPVLSELGEEERSL